MWTRFARSGHQGEKTDSRVRNRADLPVLYTTETNRFQGSKRNRFTGSGHGEKADSRIRNRTGFEPCYKTWFGWNLNYAAAGISNLAHRPTTLFPTSSSSRIFVGEVGDPRASQSVSQAVQTFSVFKHFQERKKKEKGWLNYHHRKQRKEKKPCLVCARLCNTSVAKERSF